MSILALNISCLSSVVDLCIAQCLPQQVCQVCSSYTLSQVGNQGSFHRCKPVFLKVTYYCRVATSVDNFCVSVFAPCIDQVFSLPACRACHQPCYTLSWLSILVFHSNMLASYSNMHDYFRNHSINVILHSAIVQNAKLKTTNINIAVFQTLIDDWI